MKILADPLAWAWFGLLFGSAVSFIRRCRKRGSILLGIALISSLVQMIDVPGRLLAALERPYVTAPRQALPAADAVVVLGGYLQVFSGSYGGIGFNQASDRLLTGIALVRDGKGSVLVLGGPSPAQPSRLTEAEAAKAFIQSWKLVSVPIECLGAGKNTHDEAVRCSELAKKNGWKHLILVTSAGHLRRAASTFRKAGLDITPVGCDFREVERLEGHAGISWIPRSAALVTLRYWLEEELGYLYYSARGWI
jgi:uncharacterized SAM-binding protein YcdF (DUF218 family)